MVDPWCDVSLDLSLMVDPLRFVPVSASAAKGCNKCRGMCYSVYGILHIKTDYYLSYQWRISVCVCRGGGGGGD